MENKNWRERWGYKQDDTFGLSPQYQREPTLAEGVIEGALYVWDKTNNWRDRSVQAGFAGLALTGLGMATYTFWNSYLK